MLNASPLFFPFNPHHNPVKHKGLEVNYYFHFINEKTGA